MCVISFCETILSPLNSELLQPAVNYNILTPNISEACMCISAGYNVHYPRVWGRAIPWDFSFVVFRHCSTTQQKGDGYFNLAKVISVAAE